MKILTIAHTSALGGANISFLLLIDGLLKHNVEPFVIIPEKGFLSTELEKRGVKYAIIPMFFSIWPVSNSIRKSLMSPKRLGSFLFTQWKALKRIKKFAIQNNIDLIHTNTVVNNLGFLVAKSIGLPHYWHIREYGDKDFDFKFFYSKKILKKRLSQSYVIAITKDLKDYFDCHNGKIIYNPFKIKDIPVNFKTRQDIFIYVGIVIPHKGVEMIINSFARFAINNNKYNLEFIGKIPDENYKHKLNNIIESLGLKNRISFVGEQKNVNIFMQNSKAIIIASKSEGFGRIMVEAMVNKCIVIGRNVAGLKEQFDNGKSLINEEIGFRFNNEEDLINSMYNVADLDEEKYGKITAKAFQTVNTLYNDDIAVKKTLDFFQESQ